MVKASSVWATYDAGEWFYLLFALASVAVGLVHSIVSKSWLRWPILSWSLLGVISSSWVWDLGNNAARVFAPIVVLVALAGFGQSDKELTPDHATKLRTSPTPDS